MSKLNTYLPYRVYKNIIDKYVPFRNLKVESEEIIHDKFIRQSQTDGFTMIECSGAKNMPRNAHDHAKTLSTKLFIFIMDTFNTEAHSKSQGFGSIIESIKGLKSSSNDFNIDIIAITHSSPKPHLLKKMHSYDSIGSNDKGFVRITPLLYQTFVTVIPSHKLVPKYTVLTDEEADRILKTLFVTKTALSRIKRLDPALVWYGAEIGDVIRVVKNSETTGESIYYHQCIA